MMTTSISAILLILKFVAIMKKQLQLPEHQEKEHGWKVDEHGKYRTSPMRSLAPHVAAPQPTVPGGGQGVVRGGEEHRSQARLSPNPRWRKRWWGVNISLVDKVEWTRRWNQCLPPPRGHQASGRPPEPPAERHLRSRAGQKQAGARGQGSATGGGAARRDKAPRQGGHWVWYGVPSHPVNRPIFNRRKTHLPLGKDFH